MTPDQRAQLIDAMARAMYARLDVGAWESETPEITDEMIDAATWALDAALAWRPPCPECEGDGFAARPGSYDRATGDEKPCGACGGSGEANSPRIGWIPEGGGTFRPFDGEIEVL